MGIQFSLNRAFNVPPMANPNNHHERDITDSDSESGSDTELEMFSSKWFKNKSAMSYSYDCGNNGRIIGGQCIPEEILSLILSHVDEKSLLTCRLVCQRWKDIVDSDIWRFKLETSMYRSLQNLVLETATLFPVLYKVCINKPFNKNLIKNPSGQEGQNSFSEGLGHWKVISNGGDGWRIENPPCGANFLPEENCCATSCYATSYHRCEKQQIIDLRTEGLTPIIMDELRPTIYVSEWYAARFDCACTYSIYVALLNKKRKEIEKFHVSRSVQQWQGNEWQQVEHEFKNYPKGVRYIQFLHRGWDNQFWKGHYGSKMSGACVKINL